VQTVGEDDAALLIQLQDRLDRLHAMTPADRIDRHLPG
jgi:hypothetical protein